MADETTLLDVVTRYVLPPILGGAGGLIVIWANWGIEKERSRIQARRALVSEWRDVLVPLLEGPQDLQEGIGKYPFMRTKQYSSLRPHLREEIISNCQGPQKIFAISIWPVLHEDKIVLKTYKLGESPAFGPATPNRLLKLLGDQREIFLKGRRCENQGLARDSTNRRVA